MRLSNGQVTIEKGGVLTIGDGGEVVPGTTDPFVCVTSPRMPWACKNFHLTWPQVSEFGRG